MRSIKVEHGQSIMDIAVQEYGDVDKVFDLVRINGLNGITDRLCPGDELVIDTVNVSNKQRIDFIQQNSPIATIKDEDMASGIGFWTINKDFEVWQEV